MPDHNPTQSPHRPAETPTHAKTAGFLIGPVFLVAAIIMFLGSQSTEVPGASTPEFDRVALSIEPRRTVLTDPPMTHVAGFAQRCNGCHKLFESSWDGKTPLKQHTHISLDHGINSSCQNCHAREDRELLVLMDGTGIGYEQAETLCRQCHGPVYRDWTRGTHGKMLGSWRKDSPEAHRLKCTECHDPHSPRYDAIEPLPGPNTLRMGERLDGGHHKTDNPLRRWSGVESHQYEEGH